jgi:hypothetical protein
MQSVLRLPGHLLDLFRNPFLPLAQSGPCGGSVPITSGGFDNDASEMSVACFGDGAPLLPLSAGVLAGPRAAVPHQLPRALEPGDLAQLGYDRHRGNFTSDPGGGSEGPSFLVPGLELIFGAGKDPKKWDVATWVVAYSARKPAAPSVGQLHGGSIAEPSGIVALHDVIDAVVGVEGGAVGRAEIEGELGQAAAEATLSDELAAIAIEQIAAVAEDLVRSHAAAEIAVDGGNGAGILLQIDVLEALDGG